MSIPVRLSRDLVNVAKRAADAATRSLTAQVEHWALIGRAVETALDHGTVTQLKASGGKLSAAIPDAARRAAIIEALRVVIEGIDRKALRSRIASSAGPLYGIDPNRPEVVLLYLKGGGATTNALGEDIPARKIARRRKRA